MSPSGGDKIAVRSPSIEGRVLRDCVTAVSVGAHVAVTRTTRKWRRANVNNKKRDGEKV